MHERRTHNVAGANIRRLRTLMGLSQSALSGKCRELGWQVSRVTLAKIEAQLRRLNDAELVLISQAMGVSPRELITATEKQLLETARHSEPIE